MNILIIMEESKGKRLKFVPKIPKRNGESLKYINPVKSKKRKLEDNGDKEVFTDVDVKSVELPLKVNDENYWVKWQDRVVTFDYLVLSKQIQWLKENIFVDDKNFFFYIKRHNEKMVLMVVREAIRLLMSECMSKVKYYQKQYNPNFETERVLVNPIVKYFKISDESLKEKNDQYGKLVIEYQQKFNSSNRKMGIVRYRLLKMDPSLNKILKSISSKDNLFDYFYLKGYKTITVNY